MWTYLLSNFAPQAMEHLLEANQGSLLIWLLCEHHTVWFLSFWHLWGGVLLICGFSFFLRVIWVYSSGRCKVSITRMAAITRKSSETNQSWKLTRYNSGTPPQSSTPWARRQYVCHEGGARSPGGARFVLLDVWKWRQGPAGRLAPGSALADQGWAAVAGRGKASDEVGGACRWSVGKSCSFSGQRGPAGSPGQCPTPGAAEQCCGEPLRVQQHQSCGQLESRPCMTLPLSSDRACL